jgi:hypothetical protein
MPAKDVDGYLPLDKKTSGCFWGDYISLSRKENNAE